MRYLSFFSSALTLVSFASGLPTEEARAPALSARSLRDELPTLESGGLERVPDGTRRPPQWLVDMGVPGVQRADAWQAWKVVVQATGERVHAYACAPQLGVYLEHHSDMMDHKSQTAGGRLTGLKLQQIRLVNWLAAAGTADASGLHYIATESIVNESSMDTVEETKGGAEEIFAGWFQYKPGTDAYKKLIRGSYLAKGIDSTAKLAGKTPSPYTVVTEKDMRAFDMLTILR